MYLFKKKNFLTAFSCKSIQGIQQVIQFIFKGPADISLKGSTLYLCTCCAEVAWTPFSLTLLEFARISLYFEKVPYNYRTDLINTMHKYGTMSAHNVNRNTVYSSLLEKWT